MESAYAVKLKFHGNFITRHVWANNQEQATQKACSKKRRKKSGKRIISVQKVRAEDVIGEINEFKLIKELQLGKAPAKSYGLIEEDTTLDSIVFSKKYNMDRNNRDYNNKNMEVGND